MRCPHCACEIETNQQRLQRQLRARGLCIRCRKPSETWKCAACTKLDRIARRRRLDRLRGYEMPVFVHGQDVLKKRLGPVSKKFL